MTYNFDADRWYENQRRLVELRKDRGELDEASYQVELEALETRYDEMVKRLDRSFELPDTPR